MNYLYKEPDFSMGMASISPICGCSGGCAYCYISLLGMSTPSKNNFGLYKTIEVLHQHTEYQQGKHGTAIVIGGWGKLFPNNFALRKHSIEWIVELAKEGNPIVLSTKGILTADELEQICSALCTPEQILIFETITTLDEWKSLEPGTLSPTRRFECLQMCSEAGIRCGLLVNPFLRGITEISFDQILKCAAKLKTLEGIVVSPLFLNELLLKKMHSNCLRELADSEWKQCDLTQSGDGISICAHSLQDEWPILQKLASKTNIPLLRHYLCLISRCFNRKCFLYKNTDYCVNCGNCGFTH